MYLNIIKRIIDTLLAVIMLLILSPLFFLIAILIKIDSGSPIIFKQKRIGKDGKKYYMYKFRTMIQNALPQLWNIIKGEMAFVGPRSPVDGYFPEYSQLSDMYKKRFSVLPGITGLAQCVGRNELSWDEKVKYDNLYIEKIKKYGIFYDIKIWFMTIRRVLLMRNVE